MDATKEKTRILVVDDDASMRQLFKDILELGGFAVYCAENGQIGLSMAEKEMPNLILLDVLMPTMGGIETLKKLRETPWGTNIPVIILTNVDIEDKMQKEIMEYHVSYYLSKTRVDPPSVIYKINSILGERGK